MFGHEEDAADQVAAYIELQLGKDTARRQIAGVAYAYITEAKAEAKTTPKLERFANEHGTPAQRFYNVLCIAYGADPKLFGDLVAKGYLPKERAEGCAGGVPARPPSPFETLLGPHLDRQVSHRRSSTRAGCRRRKPICRLASQAIAGEPASRPLWAKSDSCTAANS